MAPRGGVRLGDMADWTIADWKEQAKANGLLMRFLPWTIGDMINALERERGEVAFQYMDAFGLSHDSLQDYAWVASRFKEQFRDLSIPFSYFREAASIGGQDGLELVQKLKSQGCSSKDLRNFVRDRAMEAGAAPAGRVLRKRKKKANAKGGSEVGTQSGSARIGW